MINVYIVRHGETNTNLERKVNGSATDLPLNKRGVQQVKNLQANFITNKIDCIYTSPLQRAQQTAKILNQKHHKPVIIDKRLTEMNYGNWDGQDAVLIKEDYPQVFDELGFFKENYSDYCTGETFAHLANRLASFWDDLLNKHDEENVLLVCHGTVSRCLIQNTLHIEHISQVGELQNAGVIKLIVSPISRQTYLHYYNRIAPGIF
ncbi:histidine phosphatase family protein [Bombilactobacillus thymidiniphilus]|uniref:Histidine phosphatase family protein n=1 Tax=Bombilactobacillus thymidiniphilus TaxID=2923363 RepID=A0ABY4PF81_9LACO|nr:histidine phosphatase family protein [Bombilactobacillus thymidiniphilus]UQS84257.1 histidine phosphatase family protein [Bombilactobacillus thymidiniphilus]